MNITRLCICLGVLWLQTMSVFATSGNGIAAEQFYMSLTQTQRMQANDLFKQLRCPVCAGQSIIDSDAEIAVAMRIYVMERVLEGVSHDQIMVQMQKAYGNNILMTPPLSAEHAFLWLLPIGGLAIGAVQGYRAVRSRK